MASLVRLSASSVCLIAAVTAGVSASGQSADTPISLTLRAGRSMRVALDRRITIHDVGQPVTGTLVEAVYVHDRVVLPIGSRLTGSIDRIDRMSKKKRAMRMIGGDFSPHPAALLRFDHVIGPDGQSRAITTIVKGGSFRPKRRTAREVEHDAGEDATHGRVAQVRETVTAQAQEALALLKDPGKIERLEEMAINQLPYHPEFLRKGMVYDVELVAPVSFGTVIAFAAAPPGSAPAPNSILTAKLTTTIDSARTPRGTTIAAVLTEPVFSTNHQVILPEGTTLTGEVTFAKPARRWHRNGNLRVLFASVQPPADTSRPLLASLYAVDAPASDRVSIDEEGGSSISSSKTRFIPPGLAVLAVRGSVHQEHELDDDDVGVAPHMITQGDPGARALGGFFGFGAVGAIVGHFSRPIAIAVSVYGAGRTIYANVFAKGREVTFRADTPIQVRLAPGPSTRK